MKHRLTPLLEGMEMGKSEHDWLEQRLENMTAKEELLFRGAMQIESPRDIQTTIQILQGLDHYQLLYGAEDDVLLGRFVMEHKARIARIIGNAKYIGDGEYDPIIEEEQYEEAAAVKTARQRNTFEKNLEGLDLLRDLVRCAECGAPMRRRVSSKHRIRESWDCTDPDCGQRIRISDTHLLEKVTILMNRIIANSYLLIPRPKKRKELSAEAQRINREIDAELERDDPSDALIIVKTIEMAERLYAESDTHLQIAASIARKRVSLMTPQEEFSPAYFCDIAAYLTLGSGGKVILHTKTDVEIGDEENECNQDTQENNIGY